MTPKKLAKLLLEFKSAPTVSNFEGAADIVREQGYYIDVILVGKNPIPKIVNGINNELYNVDNAINDELYNVDNAFNIFLEAGTIIKDDRVSNDEAYVITPDGTTHVKV